MTSSSLSSLYIARASIIGSYRASLLRKHFIVSCSVPPTPGSTESLRHLVVCPDSLPLSPPYLVFRIKCAAPLTVQRCILIYRYFHIYEWRHRYGGLPVSRAVGSQPGRNADGGRQPAKKRRPVAGLRKQDENGGDAVGDEDLNVRESS